MYERFCHAVMRSAQIATGALFFAMICAVALQVIARNILAIPILWTSDVAQLMFSWLIFVGAAIGLRQGEHYYVDLWPEGDSAARRAVTWFGLVVSVVVVFILVVNGWALSMARARGEIQSLGISRMWLYLSIPVSGVMMALFLVELAMKHWRGEAV